MTSLATSSRLQIGYEYWLKLSKPCPWPEYGPYWLSFQIWSGTHLRVVQCSSYLTVGKIQKYHKENSRSWEKIQFKNKNNDSYICLLELIDDRIDSLTLLNLQMQKYHRITTRQHVLVVMYFKCNHFSKGLQLDFLSLRFTRSSPQWLSGHSTTPQSVVADLQPPGLGNERVGHGLIR